MSGLFKFQLSKKKHSQKQESNADQASKSEKDKEQATADAKLEAALLSNIQETHASQISDQFKSFFSTPKEDHTGPKKSPISEESILSTHEQPESLEPLEPISDNATLQLSIPPAQEQTTVVHASASTWKAPDSWAVAMPYEEAARSRKSISLKYLQTVQTIFDEDAPPVPSTTLISPTTISTITGEGIKPSSIIFPASSTLTSPSASRTSSISSEQQYSVLEPSITSQPTTKNWAIRVYKPLPKHSSNITDTSFVIASCPLDTTAKDLKTILSNKFFSHDYSKYQLYVVHRGSERLLYDEDRPLRLQKLWLEELGYTEADNLPMIGQEDNSYAFKFLFMEYNPSSSIPRSFHRQIKSQSGEFAPGITETRADLSGQDLYMMPVILFRYASTLKHLDMSKNLMLNLPMDLVQSCISLVSIRMAECELYTLPPALSYADTLTKLDLSMNLLQGKSLVSLEALHNLIELNLQSNQVTEIPPNLAVPLSTLQVLNLASNGLVQFPDVILSSWKNLIYINMAFNFIRYIPTEISGLVKLRGLNMVCNQLVSLPETFSLPNLTLLDIRGNAIQDISMISMPKLTNLIIDHNSIGSFPTLSLPQIQEITASRNALSHIQLKPDASPLSNLSILSLSGSKLVSLPSELFEYCPRLESLTLDDNQIRNIPPIGVLSSSLRLLSMVNNKLTELPNSIGELGKLTHLNLRGNNLKTLPDEIWFCSSLSVINVSSNLLYLFPIPKSPEANMSQSLMELYLGDNRLHDDSLDAIQYLVNLEILNLSYNSYYEIGSSMKELVNLKELYLSGNQLMSLPDEIDKMRNLKILFVNSNKLATLPAELGKINVLTELDASDNNLRYNITNWPYDWNWNWNVELRYLNLSGNRKFDIRPTGVTHTSADGSRNLADFSSLQQLNILDVTGVRISTSSIPQEQQDRRVRWSKQDQLSTDNDGNLPPSMFGVADYLSKTHCICWDSANVSRPDKELVAALFDGRDETEAGGKIAKYLNDTFYSSYRNEIQELRQTRDITTIDGLSSLYQDALRRCFLNMNRDIPTSLVDRGSNGSSAIVAHLMATRLLVANVGDVMGVICRAGHPLVVSTRHSPWNRAERARIRRVGGYVKDEDGSLHGMVGVSRAFGYHDLIPSIVSDPSLYVIELTESDEFIILANHGLWKWIDPQTAIDIARTESDDCGLTARKLRDSAILSGASEHISVMVIGLQSFHSDIVDSTSGSIVTTVTLPIGAITESKKRRSQKDDVTDSSLARLGHEIPPPVGHVTIVFTDVRNSTLLWEAQPAAMEAAMKLHNTIMRRLLRTVGGYEVKTEGDAFMAAFPTVFKALKWCLFAQSQLLEAEWPQEILDSEEGAVIKDRSRSATLYRGLSVRMGLHCGAPICEPDPLTQRMDYFGSVVIKAARVSATALGGQIVATSDIHTVFQGMDEAERIALLDPIFFELGERKLKGLEQMEFVYAVYPRSLAARFGFVPAPIIGSSLDERRGSDAAFPLDTQMMQQLGGIADRLEDVAKQFSRNVTRNVDNVEIRDKSTHDLDTLESLESIISRIEMATSAISLVRMDQYAPLIDKLREALDTKDPIRIIKTLRLYQNMMGE